LSVNKSLLARRAIFSDSDREMSTGGAMRGHQQRLWSKNPRFFVEQFLDRPVKK
jgi:hypothetical protein